MNIKSITLEINGVDVSIPLDQAKELHKQLGELFDKKSVSVPIFMERPAPYNPNIWYSNGSNTAGGVANCTTTSKLDKLLKGSSNGLDTSC